MNLPKLSEVIKSINGLNNVKEDAENYETDLKNNLIDNVNSKPTKRKKKSIFEKIWYKHIYNIIIDFIFWLNNCIYCFDGKKFCYLFLKLA